MTRRIDGIDALPEGLAFVATVGVFDGVHVGHVALIRALVATAGELGAEPVAITFDPHPEAVVTGTAPRLLCSVEERVALLGAAGARIVVVQRFDDAFRAQAADAFLDRLRAGRRLRGLVMSPESAFGRDRAGTTAIVARLAAAEGWRLVEAPLVEVDGTRVSSGRIRQLLDAGRRDEAERLLGRAADRGLA